MEKSKFSILVLSRPLPCNIKQLTFQALQFIKYFHKSLPKTQQKIIVKYKIAHYSIPYQKESKNHKTS